MHVHQFGLSLEEPGLDIVNVGHSERHGHLLLLKTKRQQAWLRITPSGLIRLGPTEPWSDKFSVGRRIL